MNSIRDYYSRVPFEVVIWNKYQTKKCILDTISRAREANPFNPYKVRAAFKRIEKMLENLVALPWHKEFRRIQTTSGLFKLEINGPLSSVEEIFEGAGFQMVCPRQLVLPEEKMPQKDDGEGVLSTIFDLLVAQVVLDDIIEILERSCPKIKSQNETNLDENANCYSWIYAYFQERTHTTTERSCANIQQLLNNVTNNLSKVEWITVRPGPKNEKHLGSTVGGAPSGLSNNNSKLITDKNGSLKMSAQERTRKFLAQQSIDDENLLRIADESTTEPPSELNKKHFVQNGSTQTSARRVDDCNSYLPRSNRGSGSVVQYFNLPDIDDDATFHTSPEVGERTRKKQQQRMEYEGQFGVNRGSNMNRLMGSNHMRNADSREQLDNMIRDLDDFQRKERQHGPKYNANLKDVDNFLINPSDTSDLTWHCQLCSFVNNQDNMICRMCNRSRSKS